MGKVVGVIILNSLKTTRAMLMNVFIVITQDVRFLLGPQSILLVLADLLPVKRFIQKMDCIEKSNSSPPSTSVLTLLSYPGLIRVKIIVLKNWILNENC